MKAVTGEGIAVTGRRCYYYSRHFIDDSQPIISSICQGGPLLLEKQETPANHYVQVRFGHSQKKNIYRVLRLPPVTRCEFLHFLCPVRPRSFLTENCVHPSDILHRCVPIGDL
jgi:hypothetical protein